MSRTGLMQTQLQHRRSSRAQVTELQHGHPVPTKALIAIQTVQYHPS